jgi:fatty-acyl-CoA synthase
MINLTSFIGYRAKRSPHREALLYDGLRTTYPDLLDRAERVAGGLAQRGVGTGDVAAALMKNSAAFLDLALATSHIGSVFLPIN